MKKILVFAGKKKSGKTSGCNFVSGLVLQQTGIISGFNLSDKGELLVNTDVVSARGSVTQQKAIMDLNRKDFKFVEWAYSNVWPNVKIFNFADALKSIATQVFQLKLESVYGTDEQKSEPTHITWGDISFLFNPKVVSGWKKSGKIEEFITGRDFLQIFGTNVCRKVYNDCWAQNTINRINQEDSEINIIGDCRFKNEVTLCRKNNAKIIKLDRTIEKDNHESETDLDDMDNEVFDLVIPHECDMQEKNDLIYGKLLEWEWLEAII